MKLHVRRATHWSVATLFSLPVLVAAAAVQEALVKPILPADFVWFSPPGNSSLQGAWALGGEDKPGPYLLRVKLAAGGRIPPHTHPDERNSTVLSGTLYVGFGVVFDEAKVVAVPTGGVYVAPANVPHYVWARDGEAAYQESGSGPTATVPVRR